MKAFPLRPLIRGIGLLCAALTLSACMGRGPGPDDASSFASIDQSRHKMALLEASEKQSSGERVWCVPFARTASGVQIQGDAKTWWSGAKGVYDRGNKPRPGAVMAFSATRGLSRGHVAVVSEVISDREITINHANWIRNQVQLDMRVIDVSRRGDWSSVKVERVAGEMGISAYPIAGFIYPN